MKKSLEKSQIGTNLACLTEARPKDQKRVKRAHQRPKATQERTKDQEIYQNKPPINTRL